MVWNNKADPRESEMDPLDRLIQRAIAVGWSLWPQIAHGSCDNALIRTDGEATDIVTIPLLGYSTVVRLDGGPRPGHPRQTGIERWRRHLPVESAMEWLLSGPDESDL